MSIVINPVVLDKLQKIKIFKASPHQAMRKCADALVAELEEMGLDMEAYESMYNVHSTGFSR